MAADPALAPGASLDLDSVAAPSKRRRNWLGWCVALIILASCFLFIDVGDVVAAVRQLTGLEVAVLLVLHTLDRTLMGYKWGRLLQLLRVRLPIGQAIRIFYQGNLSGAFLPSHVGGDILRVLWVREATGATEAAAASLVMERLLGLLCALNWGIIGAAALCAFLLPQQLVWVLLGGLAAAVVANGLFVQSMMPRCHALVLRLLGRGGTSKIVNVLSRFYQAYAGFGSNRRGLAVNALLTFAEHGLRMLTFYANAYVLGIAVDPIAFFAATALYMVILRFPIAPDGWGVGELAAIGVYGLIGVSASDAFAISVLGHVIPMLALLPGFVFMLRGSSRMAPIALDRQSRPAPP